GELPLGLPVVPAPPGLPVRQADAATADHPDPSTARSARHRFAAAHRAGIRPVRDRLLRVAVARHGRTLPPSGGARRRAERDPSMDQVLAALDAVLANVGHLGCEHPTLVDTEVEGLQTQRLSDRTPAAGVLEPQPGAMLPEHDERLSVPR